MLCCDSGKDRGCASSIKHCSSLFAAVLYDDQVSFVSAKLARELSALVSARLLHVLAKVVGVKSPLFPYLDAPCWANGWKAEISLDYVCCQ